MLNLQVLHDAAVYETLRLRYFHDNIYTQAGPTSLISINPYKQVRADRTAAAAHSLIRLWEEFRTAGGCRVSVG